jgi:hypothetical protein
VFTTPFIHRRRPFTLSWCGGGFLLCRGGSGGFGGCALFFGCRCCLLGDSLFPKLVEVFTSYESSLRNLLAVRLAFFRCFHELRGGLFRDRCPGQGSIHFGD